MLRLDQPDLKTIEHLAQQQDGCISFAQGALRIGGVDNAIREHAREILKTDKADYYAHSLGIAPLRQKLADTLSRQFDTTIDFEQVVVTHGSLNGIAALCLLLLESGDEVILPEPTYPPFMNAVSLARAAVKFVSAYTFVTSDKGAQWAFDFERLQAACTERTKMIIIAHPSNPCGVALSQQELADLAAWCESRGIYCIFDEAYENYFFDAPVSSSTVLVNHSDYIIRTGSFSKTYGMSGWRVGYVVAPKKIISHLAAVQDGLIVCPSVIGQHAAVYALDHPEFAASYTHYVRKNRDNACHLLQPLVRAGILNHAVPAAGFFLFMQLPSHDLHEIACQLLKRGVAVVPGKDFGPSGACFVRLCYARPASTVEEGLRRFVEFFGTGQRG